MRTEPQLFREALGFGYASYLINAEWWLGANNALRLTGEDTYGDFVAMDGRKEKDGSVMLETPYGNRFYFEPAERPGSRRGALYGGSGGDLADERR